MPFKNSQQAWGSSLLDQKGRVCETVGIESLSDIVVIVDIWPIWFICFGAMSDEQKKRNQQDKMELPPTNNNSNHTTTNTSNHTTTTSTTTTTASIGNTRAKKQQHFCSTSYQQRRLRNKVTNNIINPMSRPRARQPPVGKLSCWCIDVFVCKLSCLLIDVFVFGVG